MYKLFTEVAPADFLLPDYDATHIDKDSIWCAVCGDNDSRVG
jgi:hypothetical protein